ncbi:hypothetical protein GS3922_16725 [Geobacillus subterraneus]|uniref:Uncharacterized protein n=4 Tax=Bacillales TaxID=1385 RepID=A0A7U9J9D3_GEOTM|nr:hypothetical protein GT3570_16090 [Geobacillus thermoleovorans]AMX85125.1 hypothetical protein GS3922_16725 [Geobacillus subterraneus]ESU71344.1 hypothetical protein T260_13595 [Geobacillus sp. MAS1]KDE46241.1 hypothetical protein DI44_17445 [Geobacillus sp. CAMR5420]NNV07892.1 hypothetical protein [Geobacillus sp. MMMUD3]OXB85328.1 hypothetical protein B9L21_16900 [Geobacillus uzenensis]PJW13203.1 hypothetical protein CV945_15420 [Geobacillus sp. Manikaran-105]QCK81201.1 hypothetical pro
MERRIRREIKGGKLGGKTGTDTLAAGQQTNGNRIFMNWKNWRCNWPICEVRLDRKLCRGRGTEKGTCYRWGEGMNQRLFAEEMWKSLLDKLYEGKMVSTFKGKEAFRVVSFSDEGVIVRLSSKEKDVFLSKKAMVNVIEKLIAHEDGVRKKMVDPEFRLKLGLFLLHPWTEKVVRQEEGKRRPYLLLTDEARQRLASGE